MSEEVVFKGSRSGLKLVLANTADFSLIENLIKQKLDSSLNFFQRGTVIQLDAQWLNRSQKKTVEKIFASYGLVLKDSNLEKVKVNEMGSEIKTHDTTIKRAPKELKTTIVNQTIRNGQEVISDGSVVINGNVNPGANVIAGGNIDVRGSCRGIVHAGAFGDTTAQVMADHLIPMQIRIADLVARAPDRRISKSDAAYPEKAYINNGQIVLEAISR